ncbi:hypothetical protein ACIGO8_14340 [Streptomyces sp. NPDC053493]|uniref:hypothetical protein n=1 Tax=Streptomyces sp. NPDC053493 TaxID=3365705 RepID=UPI0037CFEF83
MSVTRQRGAGRTAGGRTAAARTAGSLAAAVCVAALLPGTAWAADGAGTDVGYAFDGSARRVKGAVSNLDAELLTPGQSYRDAIKKDGKLYYRVDLDAQQNAYVSVVAIPRAATAAVGYGDGVKVTLQDASGARCGYQDVNFGASEVARPLTAYADRTIEPGSTTCQAAGAYYVLVERTSSPGADAGDWDLEILHLTEPGVRTTGPTALPENWPSGTPAPPTGGPNRRDGGAGFHGATALKPGEWRTDIRPGQTVFYRVPVDWGQQIFAGAQLGSSPVSDTYIGNALVLSLANPAGGHVDRNTLNYDGQPATVSLEPYRPVAFENRFSSNGATSALRFAGWYYVSATLSPEVATAYGDKPLPMTVRIDVTGQPKAPPAYDGSPGPFAVSEADRDAAASGARGSATAATEVASGTWRTVGFAGIGLGTVLVLGLGAWWLLARRAATGAGGGPTPG